MYQHKEADMRTKDEAKQKACEIVDNWSTGALLTGWIPGSSIFLAAADAAMIRRVADTFAIGVIDMDAVKAHLGGLVASAVGGSICAEVLGAIPLIGWGLKSAGMAVKAELLGNAVIEYFYERSPLPA
jgi:hypothetical protein